MDSCALHGNCDLLCIISHQIWCLKSFEWKKIKPYIKYVCGWLKPVMDARKRCWVSSISLHVCALYRVFRMILSVQYFHHHLILFSLSRFLPIFFSNFMLSHPLVTYFSHIWTRFLLWLCCLVCMSNSFAHKLMCVCVCDDPVIFWSESSNNP